MARSSELEQHMRERLSAAAAFAKAISPDAPPLGTGYKYDFHVETHQFPDGVPVGTLSNDNPLWAIEEYGSSVSARHNRQGGSSPAQHTLSRALAFLQQTA
jgi:hypothetical protein